MLNSKDFEKDLEKELTIPTSRYPVRAVLWGFHFQRKVQGLFNRQCRIMNVIFCASARLDNTTIHLDYRPHDWGYAL